MSKQDDLLKRSAKWDEFHFANQKGVQSPAKHLAQAGQIDPPPTNK